MPKCEKCTDPYTEYQWFQDRMENWKLGIKIDENMYREHVCKVQQTSPTKYWCFDCGAGIPYKNPCIHRRQKLFPEKEKVGLTKFY